MAVEFHRVLAAVVVFVVTGLITTCNGLVKDATTEGVKYALVFYISLALISIAIINWNYKSKYERHQSAMHQGRNDNRPRDKLEHVLEEFALPIGLVIFGAAAIALRFFYFVADMECFGFHKNSKVSYDTAHMPEIVCRLVFNLSVLLFQCIQLPFLIRLHTLKWLKVAYKLHHLLLVIAGADFVVWLHSFYKAADLLNWEGIVYATVPLEKNTTLAEACHNFSSATNIFVTHTLNYTLLSFNMKFMLASLEILLHVWMLPLKLPEVSETEENKPLLVPISDDSFRDHNCQTSGEMDIRQRNSVPAKLQPMADEQIITDNSNTESEEAIESVNDDSLFVINREDLQESVQHIKLHQSLIFRGYSYILGVACNFYTALLTGLIHMVLMQFYVVNFTATKNSYNATTYMSAGYFAEYVSIPVVAFHVCSILIPSVLVSIHCNMILSKSRKVRSSSSRLSGNYVILALSNGANLLLCCYELTVYIARMKKSGFQMLDLLSVAEVSLLSVQFIAQSLVVYYGQRRQVSGYSGQSSLQTLLTYLAIYNFLEWVKDAFVTTRFLSHRHGFDDTDVNGVDTWRVFVELFLPPCAYFRYSCCLLLLRVKRLVGDTEESDEDIHMDNVDKEHDTCTSRRVRRSYGSVQHQAGVISLQ